MKLFLMNWLLIVCLMVPEVLYGQEGRRQTEQLETLFKVLRPAERKTVVEGYTNAMINGFFTEEEKARIDTIFEELQALHVTVNPELRNYVSCVAHFYRAREKENLGIWLKGMEQVLSDRDRKRTAVKNYLETTYAFTNGQTVYRGSGHRWIVRGKSMWKAGWPVRIDFSDADLWCVTPKDSIAIYATRGYILLGEDKLYGQGGRVTWRSMEDSIRVELADYQIDMKLSGYTADSVLFYYGSHYPQPLSGRLKDNALKYTRKKDVPYPDFSSYSKDIVFHHLYPGVSYYGGVNYSGLKFRGEGTEEQPARIEIVPNNTISIKLSARQFLFDSLRILSTKAAMVIGMDSGGITHPNINFLYSVPRHTVTVKRISEESLHVPFNDSYHGILFDMEEIFWPIDSSYMEMKMSSRSGLFKATIESLNFFSNNVYDNIQGLDEIHPLNGLLKCSLSLATDSFTLSEYADFMNKPVDQLRKQVVLLSYEDFVTYDEEKDKVSLKQRLYDYTKARIGKQDYDNIRFVSHPNHSRVNALLDVRNYNLKIMGVRKLMISEARNVYAEPSDEQVLMLKNRDMEFNGRLNAGMFDMYGQHLFFSYKNYKIELLKIDSMGMYLAGKNKHLRGEKIKSLIRNVVGEIIIDKQTNKSGKEEDPDFPVLNSRQESYVYFDDPTIQEGKYERKSFYFVIKPYSIHGINDVTKFRYVFDGTLVSHIVSPIEDTLRLMDDHALGLSYQTPVTGSELYEKGRIQGQILLNQKGFQANGKVNLNRSYFNSDSILMLPARMLALAPEMEVEAVPGQRPGVSGKQLQVEYLPGTDQLLATSTTLPLEIYEGRMQHEGTLFVYDQLLDASGKLKMEEAVLHSKLLHLAADYIRSEHTALDISSISNQNIRLNTSDVHAEINLLANKGRFVNNVEANRAEFTSNRYTCSFESFTWYMKEAYLNIGIEEEEELQELWKIEQTDLIPRSGKNVFISTDRQTDSLNFIAPLAYYDLNTGDIKCHWVNHIDVANGRFYPEKGEIFIQAGGRIQEFTGGKLLCERRDTTKVLADVCLNLKGKYCFNGTGDYTYVSEEKEASVIRFTELGVDTLKNIWASVEIGEAQPLMLNTGLRFKGKATLHSTRPYLFFKGYVGLTANRDFLDHQWMAINSELDGSHILIPMEVENRNDKQQRIYNGIFLYADQSFRPYGAFMSNRQFYKDDLLSGGKGEMEWLASSGQYIIRDTSKDDYYRFCYDTAVHTISAFSRLDLDVKLPGMIQLAVGNISYHLKEEKMKISDILYLIDFSLLTKMEAVFQKDLIGSKQKVMTVPAGLRGKLYELYGKEVMPELQKQMGHSSDNVPDSLRQFLVLNSLDISWNEKTHSYMADGPVHLLASGGKPMNRQMNIKLEIIRRHAGNQFFMYIYDDQMWYYFEYTDGALYTLSSNTEYNEILKTEKAEKKIIQTKEKELLYTITLCPESKKERFLGRFQ